MDKSRYLPFYMAYFGSRPGIGREEVGEVRTYEETMEQENPLEEELNRQEREEVLMQSFYPPEIQILQSIVEQVCDEEDYGGSRIYDEYPDRRMLERTGRKIADRAQKELPDFFYAEESQEYGLTVEDYDPYRASERRNFRRDKRHRRNPLEELAEVLLFHEIRRRRCRNGRCRGY